MSDTKESEKNGTAIPQKEELVDMVIKALKRNHNWKLLLGTALGWILAVYVF